MELKKEKEAWYEDSRAALLLFFRAIFRASPQPTEYLEEATSEHVKCAFQPRGKTGQHKTNKLEVQLVISSDKRANARTASMPLSTSN